MEAIGKPHWFYLSIRYWPRFKQSSYGRRKERRNWHCP